MSPPEWPIGAAPAVSAGAGGLKRGIGRAELFAFRLLHSSHPRLGVQAQKYPQTFGAGAAYAITVFQAPSQSVRSIGNRVKVRNHNGRDAMKPYLLRVMMPGSTDDDVLDDFPSDRPFGTSTVVSLDLKRR